ncbi:hypothetical protein L208DRAFT_1322030, partial [Tricholoma matsutake]
ALSCYSVLIQLYLHSGQLPMAAHLHSQHRIESQHCCFGCFDIPEDDHHLFVECPYFTELHLNSGSNVVRITEAKCQDLVEGCLLSLDVAQHLVLAAKSLFSDDGAFWPLHHSAFYLGQIPDATVILGLTHPLLIFRHLSDSPIYIY